MLVRRMQNITDRFKATITELREMQQRYLGFLEDQTELICRFKADGTIVYVNDAFCHLFDKPRKALIGNKWHPVAHQDDLQSINEKLNSLSPECPVITIENRIFTAGGELRWGQFINRGFFDGEGRLLEVQSIGRDITESKAREQQLMQLNFALDHSKELVYLLNENGGFLYANQEVCRILGYTKQELLGGLKIKGIQTDMDDEKWAEHWQILKQNGAYTMLSSFRTRDGNQFPVEIHANYFQYAGGDYKFSLARDITEIKQAEQALQKSEELFRTLAEAVPQIVWMTDSAGLNTYFNQQWVEYTGLTLAESYGHGWNKPFHPDDRQRAWDAWQLATETDGVYSLECRLRRADGLYRWWLVRGRSMHDANGNVIAWFGTCTDIQDLKLAEETLHTLDKRLNMALEFSDLGVWDLDLLLDTAWRTPKHDQIFGYESLQPAWGFEEALRHVAPEDRAMFADCFQEAFRTGRLTLECRVMHTDGSLHWINAHGRVVYDENARPIQMLGTVADVTERKTVEQEMALAATIFNSQEGMFITDADRLILRVNSAFTRITGYTQAEVLGRNPHILSSDRHDTGFYQAMWESINKLGVWESEIWNRRKNGEIYPEYLIITVVKDAKGSVINYVGTFNDITQLKEAEQKLQDAYQQLQQSLESQIQQEKLASLGVLVGGLAHEINNPLMGIQNYIQFAYDKTDENRSHEMLGKALKEVNRIAKLVRGMLTFVSQASEDQHADLSGTLTHVLSLIEGDLKKNHISLCRDLPDVLPQLAVNADALEQILLNVLLNAIYALKTAVKPRQISIAVQPTEDAAVEIRIQDNAAGVADQIRSRIFDPFFTTKPPGQGTGLGLAVSKRIAEAVNGKLELTDSTQGACFTLTLPIITN